MWACLFRKVRECDQTFSRHPLQCPAGAFEGQRAAHEKQMKIDIENLSSVKTIGAHCTTGNENLSSVKTRGAHCATGNLEDAAYKRSTPKEKVCRMEIFNPNWRGLRPVVALSLVGAISLVVWKCQFPFGLWPSCALALLGARSCVDCSCSKLNGINFLGGKIISSLVGAGKKTSQRT